MNNMKEAVEIIMSIGFLLLGIAWSFGAAVGVLYWAWHNNLWNVAMSFFVPFYGAISVAWEMLS